MQVFLVSLGLVQLWAALTHGVLYPLHSMLFTPYLNRFRGKPAISEFDWLFQFALNKAAD